MRRIKIGIINPFGMFRGLAECKSLRHSLKPILHEATVADTIFIQEQREIIENKIESSYIETGF